jgi:hypothetical protein
MSLARRSPAPVLALAFSFLLVAALPAFAAGKPELFYSVGLGGYSPASYGAPEALELSGGLELLPRSPVNPAIVLRLLLPINPADFSEARASAGVELSLGYFLRHPFAWVSPRRLAWTPSVGMAFSARLGDLSDTGWVISLSPIRLFTGNSYQSFGSIVFPFSSNFASEGWGIRLAEFSYLLR